MVWFTLANVLEEMPGRAELYPSVSDHLWQVFTDTCASPWSTLYCFCQVGIPWERTTVKVLQLYCLVSWIFTTLVLTLGKSKAWKPPEWGLQMTKKIPKQLTRNWFSLYWISEPIGYFGHSMGSRRHKCGSACTVGSQVASREVAHRLDRRRGMLFWYSESAGPLFKRLSDRTVDLHPPQPRACYLLTQRAKPL